MQDLKNKIISLIEDNKKSFTKINEKFDIEEFENFWEKFGINVNVRLPLYDKFVQPFLMKMMEENVDEFIKAVDRLNILACDSIDAYMEDFDKYTQSLVDRLAPQNVILKYFLKYIFSAYERYNKNIDDHIYLSSLLGSTYVYFYIYTLVYYSRQDI